MKGLWLSGDNTAPKGTHVARILSALNEKREGLSNAELDTMLGTASQWLIFWELRQLVALDLVKYETQPFGESGKYVLTDKGLALTGNNLSAGGGI